MSFCSADRAIAAAALALAACTTEGTQLYVVVDSDLRVPDELAMVRAQILESRADPSVVAESGDLSLGTYPLPLSLGIAPRGDLDVDVVIEVNGYDGAGTRVASLRAVTRFVEGRSVRISMVLLRSCLGQLACPANQTCRDGDCRPDAVEPTELVEPEKELVGFRRPPPSTPDAGVPADAGLPDAGSPVDAGVRDAEPIRDAAGLPDAMPRDAAGFPDAMPPRDAMPADALPPPPDGGAGDAGPPPPPAMCTSTPECVGPKCWNGRATCECLPNAEMNATICIPRCTSEAECDALSGWLTCDLNMGSPGICVPER